MAQVTTIKEDGTIIDSPVMNHNEARDLYNSLKNDGSNNVYVFHFV